MIITSRNTLPFTVDIGRPSILNQQAIDRWSQIHTWVKESKTPVVVSPAFRVVDHFLVRDQYYQGGGYHYTFWFKTKEDKDEFVVAVQKAREDHPSI